MESAYSIQGPQLARKLGELSKWKSKKNSTREFYARCSDALVNAGHMQGVLKQIDRLPAPIPAQVRSRLSADSLTAIENSIRIKWLPIAVDKELTEILWEVLTKEQFQDFWVGYGLTTVNSPLLRHLIGAAVRLFGDTISRLCTWTPRVYEAYFRNCGKLSVGDRSRNHCNLVFTELPPEMIRSRPNVESCAYCFAAIYPLAHKKGKITIKDYDTDRCSVTFLLEWN